MWPGQCRRLTADVMNSRPLPPISLPTLGGRAPSRARRRGGDRASHRNPPLHRRSARAGDDRHPVGRKSSPNPAELDGLAGPQVAHTIATNGPYSRPAMVQTAFPSKAVPHPVLQGSYIRDIPPATSKASRGACATPPRDRRGPRASPGACATRPRGHRGQRASRGADAALGRARILERSPGPDIHV